MAVRIVFCGKEPLDNLETLCCWCYKISWTKDDDDKINSSQEIGLESWWGDVVVNPKNYECCNDYRTRSLIDPIPDTDPDVTASVRATYVYKKLEDLTDAEKQKREFVLKFIAPCAEDMTKYYHITIAYNRLEDERLGGGTVVGPRSPPRN